MENIGEHSRQRALMYSDDELMTLLQELHIPTDHPDYTRRLNSRVWTMFSVVESLITRATETIGEHTKDASLVNQITKDPEDDARWKIIGSVSCQATREILKGNDADTVTVGVLKYLKDYGWEDRVVLTLTAFSVTFGDFWLHVRTYAGNAVKERMTVDQREPQSANDKAYIHQIEANNDFIKSLVNTTQRLFQFIDELLPRYCEEMFGVGEGPHMHTPGKSDRFSVYAYWIMRCAIVAATHIIILSRRGLDQYLVGTPDPMEFDKLKSLNGELELKFSDFRERQKKWYDIPSLWGHSDIVGLMKTVINPEKDLHPLYHSVTKRKGRPSEEIVKVNLGVGIKEDWYGDAGG